jgi:hypothetical protein
MSGTKPTPGVTITLTGDASDSAVTDANGEFSFDLPDGSYVLTPSKDGHQLSPSSANVEVSGADDTGNDFTAVAVHTLSGTITGDEIEGVTITLTGDASDSTTTDENGDYSFTLPAGEYNVEPSLTGYEFDPTDIDVTIVAADDTDNDFVSYDLSLVVSMPTAIYFDSAGSPFGVPTPEQISPVLSLDVVHPDTINEGWDIWRYQDVATTRIYGPAIRTAASVAVNGFTPNTFGDSVYSYKLNGGDADAYQGGIAYSGFAELGKHFDVRNGFRVMMMVNYETTNSSYNTFYFAIASSAGGYFDANSQKYPKCRFQAMLNARTITPDKAMVREYVDGALLGTGEVAMSGAAWNNLQYNWHAIGMEFPPGLTGKIGTYMHVPTIYGAGKYLPEVYEIAGDWSSLPLDLIGHLYYEKYSYDDDARLAWYWIGSLTDDWPV